MIKAIDTITGDELEYKDIEDFREVSKHSFDESVHDVIDELADAYSAGQPTQEFESYLGIELTEAQEEEHETNGCWKGEGWYNIGWSDGGMDWTNEGPVWFEAKTSLEEEIEAASAVATETHIPYAEYMGDEDEPREQ